jgi:outer membrane protein OmpA-like peptidoglycan-associated protein
LQGVAKTGAGRDRLLAAIARALPNEVRFEDRTTVPTEAAEDLFSRNIYFNTGSSYIKPEHREHLREAVAALKASGVDVTLLIKGHADSRGDPQINESLSRERAKAVYDLLARQGVEPKQMEFVGVGAAEAETANGEYAWKQERRVELTVVK